LLSRFARQQNIVTNTFSDVPRYEATPAHEFMDVLAA
jgi:hypothetical protein